MEAVESNENTEAEEDDYPEDLPLAEEAKEEDEEEAEDEEVLGTVITIGETPVRTDPDGLAPIDVSLEEGTEITVIAVEGDWIKIQLEDGSIGYIYKDDISEEDLAALTEALTEKENAEEEEEEEEQAETPKTVTIFTSRRTVMTEGETVTLTSRLEGFEDCEEILYVWKVDKGNGFEEVEGANSDSYSFPATAESLSWGWHLTVLYC